MSSYLTSMWNNGLISDELGSQWADKVKKKKKQTHARFNLVRTKSQQKHLCFT